MSDGAWIVVVVVIAVIAVITLIGALRLARRLWATKRMLGELGAGGKIAFYGALIYTVVPIDLIPDPIYLDDMGVLSLALLYLTNLLHRRREGAAMKRDQPRR